MKQCHSILFSFFLFIQLSCFSQTKPNQIPGLTLWLRADSNVTTNGSAVSAWNDCSGQANHALQATPSQQPLVVLNGLNNKPIVRLDGSDDFFNLTNTIKLSGDFSYYQVYKIATTNTIVVGLGNTGMRMELPVNYSDGQMYIDADNVAEYLSCSNSYFKNFVVLCIRKVGSVISIYVNGKFITSGSISTSFTTNAIGKCSFATSASVDFAEFILYNSTITTVENDNITAYLFDKYAQKLSLNPTTIVKKSLCDTTVHAGLGYNSYLWSTGETTESITANKGKYTVTAIDANGFPAIGSTVVSYSGNKLASHKTILCQKDSLYLKTSTKLTGYTYHWNTGYIGDSLKIKTAGSYYATVTNGASCILVTDTAVITVDNFPTIATLGNDTALCSGNLIGLTNKPLPSGLSYKWSTTGTTPQIAITTSGTYKVTVTNSNNCVASDAIYVTVSGIAPVANYTVTTGCAGEVLQFRNTSTPLGDTWLWTFGDGNSSTTSDQDHSYSSGGTFDATLLVSSSGCKKAITKQLTIPQKPSIPALLYPTDKGIVADSVLTFHWKSSSNSNNSVFSIALNADFSTILYTSNPITVDSFQYTVSSNVKELYWRVTSYNACGMQSSAINKTNFFFASTIPSLDLWFNADKLNVGNNNPVTTWTSANNPAIAINQATAANQPLLKTKSLNGHSVVRFDGVNDYLDGGTTIGNIPLSGASIFIVGKSTAAQGAYLSKSLYGGGGGRYAIEYDPQWSGGLAMLYQDNIDRTLKASAHPYGSYDLLSTIIDKPKSQAEMFVYGTSIGKVSINSSYSMKSNFTFLLGAYNSTTGGIPPTAGYYLKGDIAEILLFDRALTTKERTTVEAYLHTKYCTPLSLGPDITITNSLCGTTIHAGTGFKSYLWSTGDTTESITVTKSGKYLVDVVDMFEYKLTDDINVTFNVEPKLISDTTICPGATLLWNTGLDPSNFTFKWNTGATTPAITISTGGNYTVTVTDKAACSYKSDTAKIKIDDFKTSIDLGNDTTLCKFNEISLKKGNNRCVSYLWKDASTNKALSIIASGTYYVTATDYFGCKANDSIKITLSSGISPNTKFGVFGNCEHDAIVLSDSTVSRDASTINSWEWYILNDTLHGQKPSYHFKDPGIYYISLKTKTTGSCTGENTMPVTIFPKPTVSYKPNSVCQFFETTFINTSTLSSGKVSHIKWSLPDTTIQDKDSIQLSFKTAGISSIKLIVTSDKNCIDSTVMPLEVKTSPKAVITNTASCDRNAYYLFDKSIVPPSNSIIERTWYVNTFPISYAQTIKYTPNSLDAFDLVKLLVKSVNGCFDSTSKKILYSPTPVAAFQLQNACIGDTVKFFDKSTGNIAKTKWNIGDNIETFDKNPVLVFTESKIYPISLHVTSDMGCEDTILSSIKTIKKPKAHFDFEPKIVGAPVDISFSNSSDSASSYLWTFGDSFSSTEFEPIHEYADSGNYEITLHAYNDYFCADSVKQHFLLPRSNYKIVQTSILTTDKNGYVAISTIFINAGLNPLTSIDFILTKDDGTWIKETWEGLVTTGVVDTFTFASHFREMDGALPKYICIDANVLDKHDSIVAKSNKCLTQTKELTSFSVYPVPADDKLTITFATGIKGTVSYSIFDNIGKPTTQGTKEIEEGFNAITIPTDNLAQGYYIWKIETGGKSKTGSFIVNRK
jgi:PKD repeat protein